MSNTLARHNLVEQVRYRTQPDDSIRAWGQRVAEKRAERVQEAMARRAQIGEPFVAGEVANPTAGTERT